MKPKSISITFGVSVFRGLMVWLLLSLASSEAASPNPTASDRARNTQPIPWNELGARATAHYSGDGLSVNATAAGARLRCAFQKLEGEVTPQGLWLSSTAPGSSNTPFRVMATSLGRERGERRALSSTGAVETTGGLAQFIRPGLIEEYSASVDGLRQDFILPERLPGKGTLRVELDVAGATAEACPDGVRLALEGSGRKLNYHRLRATDATGRELASWMEISNKSEIQKPKAEIGLTALVEDGGAVYPVRIDPTFSDANWTNIGGLPGANRSVYAVAVDGSGNLYIGGKFTMVGGVVANYLARWNGDSWSELGSGTIDSYVWALAVSGSDLYAGGDFTAGGSAANYLAKWNGSSWSPLGLGLGGPVETLAVSGSDLYAGGWFTTAGGSAANHVAKWNGNGWSALGSGMNQTVYALAVSGSDLYAGGLFTMDGSAAIRVAKWNGSNWSALGSGMNGGVFALALSGSDLYAGGDFTTAGGSAANHLAKWNGSSWTGLGSGVNNTVFALAASGSDVYAGGWFTTAGGSAANYIAKWNASSWSALGLGMNDRVNALAVSGADLYAGGAFWTAGDKVSANIARVRIGSVVKSIAESSSSALIQFSGVTGYGYDVQRATSLNPPIIWTTVTTSPLSPADDGSFTFTDTNAPPGAAHYRAAQR